MTEAVVLYDFEAESEVELSVKAGDKVIIAEVDNDVDDGWTLVSRNNQKGYVPSAFVKASNVKDKSTPNQQTSDLHSTRSVRQSNTPQSNTPVSQRTNSTRAHTAAYVNTSQQSTPYTTQSEQFFSPSAASNYSATPRSFQTSSSRFDNRLESSAALPARDLPQHDASLEVIEQQLGEEFRHIFVTHDEWYTQTNLRRESALKNVSTSLDELIKRIQDADTRNAGVTERLNELESLIDEEKHKWQSRLEEEQQFAMPVTTSHDTSTADI